MPFHVGDYLGDTGHLSTTQHGAYLLLILHYWRTGGLPPDDAHLARICKLSFKSWVDLVKPDLEPLFRPGWRHKRIDEELEKYETIRLKRAIAGQRGGIRSGAIRTVAKFSLAQKHVKNEASAEHLLAETKQLPSKRQATTTTVDKEEDGVEKTEVVAPSQAASEAVTAKRPHEMTRAEMDELIAKKASAPTGNADGRDIPEQFRRAKQAAMLNPQREEAAE